MIPSAEVNTALALPNIANAKLPRGYENALIALSVCADLDECKDWADRMLALASYARQSEDATLQRLAEKIRARAIRRCGELLREIKTTPGRPRKGGDAPTKSSAARDAGLSRDQKVQALRVAAVDEDEFERLVESDNPPTVTALADLGRMRRSPAPFHILVDSGKFKDGVQRMTQKWPVESRRHLPTLLRDLADEIEEELKAPGVSESDITEAGE